MSEPVTTDAVVLRRVEFGESDLIVTLMTRDAGKLTCLARAARKSVRRFGSALELGTLSCVELGGRRSGDLWTLQSAASRTRFALGDVAALAHASYGAELVRELVAVEQPEPVIFDLLVELWSSVAACGPRAIVLRRFELALLAAVGTMPALETCAACGSGELDPAVFDPARGVLCSGCAAQARGLGIRPLGALARQLLIVAAGAERLAAEPLDEGGDVAIEARNACAAVVAHQVGKPLRSLEFIAKMSGGVRSV